jgi:O-antigen/teichoic acid export membrane protein
MLRMDRVFLATSIAGGLAALGCSCILIPPFAAVGAALALVIGESICSAVYIVTTFLQLRRASRRQRASIHAFIETAAPVPRSV